MGFAEVVADAGWCWFADPRALYANGRIFFGHSDTLGRVWITEVDVASGCRRRVLLADNTQVDDHGNPTLAIRGGKVCVFHATHQGTMMRYWVSTSVGTIADGFGPATVAAAGNTTGTHGFTYPSPAQMSSTGILHLLWRGGNFQPAWARSSSLGNNTWTPAQHLFSVPGDDRPYVKVMPDGDSLIHMVLTNGHPSSLVTSLYYACWDVSDGIIRRANGSTIASIGSAPIPVSSLERVWDGPTQGRSWPWDLQLDDAGHPHGTFAKLNSRADHEYRSIRWDGTAWQTAYICAAGGTIAQDTEQYYSGGVVLDPLDLSTVAVSRPASPDRLHRIERWSTADAGVTWDQAAVVSDDAAQNVRPYYVRDAPAGMAWRLLWLRGTYGSFVDWSLRLVGETTG